MKYTLQVNQIAAHGIGIQDKVDLIDLCLFDAFKSFANSARCEKMIDDQGIWFWISYAEIIREIPLAGIKTKDGIYRRMMKLKDAGIIVFHPNNQKLTKTYFQWGPNYDAMERTDWSEEPTDEKPKVVKDLRMKNRRGTDEKPNLPTDEKPNNQTTNNQTTNQESGARAKKQDLKVEVHDPEIPGVKIVEGFVAPVRGQTIDDLEKPIIEWVFGLDGEGIGPGRESVKKWYADAMRKVTVGDVKAMITKFCSVYATIGDEGKRQRMLTHPLEFFKLSFKGFIKSQDSFEAKAQDKQGQKNGNNQEAVYEEPKIPVYRAKTLS